MMVPWLPFLLAPVAAAAPSVDSAWEAVVARLTSPLEARWTPSEAKVRLAAACDAGRRAACRLELGEPVGRVLAEACADGDRAACVGHGWQIQQDRPEEAFALFDTACEGGSGRACVAVAQARFVGRGTWGSRRAGRMAAEALCRGGQGDACVALAQMTGNERPRAQEQLLRQASRLGASGAAGRLARMAPAGPERLAALTNACTLGSPEACWTLAVEGEGAPAELASRACGLGIDAACVTSAALALEDGLVGVEGAIALVDRHCGEGVEEACIAAAFYRNGGRPPPFPTGAVGPVQKAMTVDEKIPYLLDCYREQLERGHTAVVELNLELATDADGVFLAATGRSGDQEAERCYADAFLGTPGQRPSGGPARFAVSVMLTHEAEIHVEPLGIDEAGSNLSHAEWRYVSQLGLDANACYLEHGGSIYDRQFAIVRGTLRNTGWYVHGDVVESSGDDATDACLADLVSLLHVPEVDMAFDQAVTIRFDFNRVGRAPRWTGWGMRRVGMPPLDLSRHNHASVGARAGFRHEASVGSR